MVLLLPPPPFARAFPQRHLQDAGPVPSLVRWRHSYAVAAATKRQGAGPPRRKIPKNLRYPRRAKEPQEGRGVSSEKGNTGCSGIGEGRSNAPGEDDATPDDSVWSKEEIEVISALFERGPPKKSGGGKLKRRPLPLPVPHKTRPPGTPTPKHHIRSVSRAAVSARSSLSARVSKNPDALVGIARDIGALPSNVDASKVLDGWTKLLRKGSLSMTIRELGHMGLPDRALQTFCWAQRHSPALFPDDRVLASTVEVLSRSSRLRMEDQVEKHLCSASRSVLEALARGFVGAGNLNMARRVLLFAKDNNRTLDPSIHAKLMLEAVKNPDRNRLVEVLLDELGDREDLDLQPQDCTAVMKACIRLGRFEAVDRLFDWFKASGRCPGVVMYTTVIHGRYRAANFRQGLAAVWEMEESNVLLDLPAYRVVIRLFAAMNDLGRAAKYFSRLKEAGFAPTYDVYRDMIKAYAASGRLAKCREICRELESAGMMLDNGMASLLMHLEQGLDSLS